MTLVMTTTGVYPPAVYAMAKHVSDCLQAHQARFSTRSSHSPLFVGIQGPQGSGKTFLTSCLRSLLAESPYLLSVAVLSIDDLYLPHARLTALAEVHPRNRLLQGRGQPGTHDIELGREILRALKTINDVEGGPDQVTLPVFDKSLFNGEGDRAAEGQVMRRPVDVVVLEGWCVGFYPVRREVLEERWRRPVCGLDAFDMGTYVSLDDVLAVNDSLRAYVDWWRALDAFVQVCGLFIRLVLISGSVSMMGWFRCIDQGAVDVAVCDYLLVAAATGAGYEGKEWGAGNDEHTSEDASFFLLVFRGPCCSRTGVGQVRGSVYPWVRILWRWRHERDSG